MNSMLLPRSIAALAVVVLIAVPSHGDVDSSRLTNFVKEGMELWHVPGMSVAVVSSDKVHYQRSFGATAVTDGRPVDEHTLFAIASTTKAMVTLGILMLVDDEKLALDDPIIMHIPELHFHDPSLTQQLTLRDLLAHRTGLPSTDYWSFFQGTPLEDQLPRLRTVSPAAPVRTRLIYQNTMFEVAGLLIERISGRPWQDFLAQRLWNPIGMQETYAARGEIPEEASHVMPFYWTDDQLEVAEWDIPEDYADAAGSVWSSIHDMSLWARFLLRGGVTADGERLVSEEGLDEMFKPHQLAAPGDFYPTTELTQPNWRSYGLAWFQQDFQGRKIDFHTGSLSGLIAMIGLDRASDNAVVILGNRDHAEMRHAVLWQVMDQTDPDRQRDWNRAVFDLYESRADDRETKWQEILQKRLENTQTSLPADFYAGNYQDTTFGEVRIETSGNQLIVKAGLVDFEMTHWHLDTFLVEYTPWEMREFATFRIGPDGLVESLDLFGFTFKPVINE